MTPDEIKLDRHVLADALRDLAEAIDLEVQTFGDSEGGEAWEISAQALRIPGHDYAFDGWLDSDFATGARVYAFLLDTTALSIDEVFAAMVKEVEGEFGCDAATDAALERGDLITELLDGIGYWVAAGSPNAEELVPAFETMSTQLAGLVGLPDGEFNARAGQLVDDMLDEFDAAIINKQEGDEVEGEKLIDEAVDAINAVEEAIAEIATSLGLELVEEKDEEEIEGYKFDASDEEARVYTFATEDGDLVEVEVEQPKTIFVVDDGTHYITDITGVLEIIPPGWLRITVYPFQSYQQVDDVGA